VFLDPDQQKDGAHEAVAEDRDVGPECWTGMRSEVVEDGE
jgi:hypothetical protein